MENNPKNIEKSFPKVSVKPENGTIALFVNDERQLPLIFAFARPHYATLDGSKLDYSNAIFLRKNFNYQNYKNQKI